MWSQSNITGLEMKVKINTTWQHWAPWSTIIRTQDGQSVAGTSINYLTKQNFATLVLYHINSIKPPWMLSKFLDLESGYLFEAEHLLIFHHFQQVVSLFCNKTINNNKMWRCTKAEF